MATVQPFNLLDPWAPTVAHKPLEMAQYRPTLVIGLGGTGCKIVQKLRRLVQPHFGPERSDAFQFLVLDTDAQRVDADEEFLGPDIFNNLAQPYIRAADIVRRMQAHPGLFPDLQTWWPYYWAEHEAGWQRTERPYLPLDISTGAHAVRAVGRFALWHQGRRVANLVQRRWGQAVEVGADYGSSAGRALCGKVYVICSLAGGTGSGMFLDVAYLLRFLLSRAAMPVFSTGMLLMDATPFREFAQSAPVLDRMNGNIYAALTELNHFMGPNRSEYGFTYSGHSLTVKSNDRPFDVCYLVGVTNEQGRQLPDLNAICNMVAESIFLEIASPLGDTGRSVLDNVEELAETTPFPLGAGRDPVSLPTAFSSLAVASLSYPREVLANVAVRRLLCETMEQITNAAPTSAAADTAQAEAMRDRLMQVVAAAADRRQPDLTFAFNMAGSSTQVQQAAGLFDAWQRDMAPETLRAAVREQLVAIIAEACAQPGGLQRAPALLEQLKGLLSEVGQQLREAANSNRGRLATIQDQAAQLVALHQAAQTRKNSPQPPPAQGQAVTANMQNWMANQAALEQRAAAMQGLDEVIDRCRAAIRLAVSTWRDQDAHRVRKGIEEISRNPAGRRYSLGFNVLSSAGIQRLVERLYSNVAVGSTAGLIQGWLTETLRADPASPPAPLGQIVFHAMEKMVCERPEIREWDLFQVLLEMEIKPSNPTADMNEAVDRALKRLKEYGVPFWRLDDSLWAGFDRVAQINLLGYQETQNGDGESAEWVQRVDQILGGTTPVRHNVPDKLVLLQTKHGVPAYVITAWEPGQQETYWASMERWKHGESRPIHLQDDWCQGQVLSPLDPRDISDHAPEAGPVAEPA
jgi:hypothetical protein